MTDGPATTDRDPQRGRSRTPTSVSVADLRRARANAAALLTLADAATDEELLAIGVTKGQLDELRAAASAAERAIPTAHSLALAALSADVTKDVVLAGYARAQRAIHALAPLVVLRLAHKIDDDQAPGSTRILIELAKGIGLLTPAEPVDPRQRTGLLELEELRTLSTHELKDRILRTG